MDAQQALSPPNHPIPVSPTPGSPTAQNGARGARRHCATQRARVQGLTAGRRDERQERGEGEQAETPASHVKKVTSQGQLTSTTRCPIDTWCR